jgi:hypothetical protein
MTHRPSGRMSVWGIWGEEDGGGRLGKAQGKFREALLQREMWTDGQMGGGRTDWGTYLMTAGPAIGKRA